jgi:predicted small secreted protein
MTKFEKQSIVWFVVYLVVLGSVILSTSSCTTTRGYGCPGQGSGMGFGGYK